MALNDEELEVAKKQEERFKYLSDNLHQLDRNGNRITTNLEERGAIEQDLNEKILDPISKAIGGKFHEIAKQTYGAKSKDSLLNEGVDETIKANEEAKQQVQASMTEIKAGIINEAAKAHLGKLVKEITHLRKQNAKQSLEITMLQKNTTSFGKEIAVEIEQMQSYMNGFTGVVNTFLDRISQQIDFRQSGVNESVKETGRTESN